MASKIGYQDGISATQVRLEKLDPDSGEVAYAKQAATLRTLKAGHNEFIDRLAALEARSSGPFPFAASSTPPGG